MVQVLTLGVGDCELVLMTLHTFARGMSTQLKLEVRVMTFLYTWKRTFKERKGLFSFMFYFITILFQKI